MTLSRILYIILLLIVFSVVKVYAQSEVGWIKTYNLGLNDNAIDAIETDSSFIVVARKQSQTDGIETVIMEIDQDGNTIRSKQHGGPGDDYGNTILQLSDGNFLVTGWSNNGGVGSYDVQLLKLNSNLDTIWTRMYGGSDYDAGIASVEDEYGNLYTIGSTYSFGPSLFHSYIIKSNAMGDTLWTKLVVDSFSAGVMIHTLDEGNTLSVHLVTEASGENSLLVLLLDSNGTEMNRKFFEHIGQIRWAYLDQNGTYLISGERETQNMGDGWLMKLNADLDSVWSRTYYSALPEEYTGVWGKSNDKIAVSGHIQNEEDQTNDIKFSIFDSAGAKVQEHVYAIPFENIIGVVKETEDHGLIAFGGSYASQAANSRNALIIKTDSNGCVWYPKAQIGYSTDTLLPGDTLFLSNSSLVHAEDSLHTIRWGFGDGKFTYDQNPWHVYEQPGAYQLWLAATNLSGCSDTSKLTIIVKDTTTALPSPIQDQFAVNVYPNPNSGQILHVDVSGGLHNARFLLYDLNGKEVLSTDITADHSNSIVLSKKHFPSGVYLWQVQIEDSQPINGKIELIR